MVADICLNPISSSSTRSHIASFAAFDAAIYSDSTVDNAMVGCFFDDQATLLPVTSNTKPPIDHLVSGSCAQSESVQPTRSTLFMPCCPRINV